MQFFETKEDKECFKKDIFLVVTLPFVIVLLLFSWLTIVHAESVPVTSNFGWRIHPITGEWKFHSGVDLGYDYGTVIPAFFDGTVVQAGDYGDGYGNQVLIFHEALDAYTRYGHFSEVFVVPGAYVYRGDAIGAVGSTGNSTGPHLHLEFIVRSADGGYEYTNPLYLWE